MKNEGCNLRDELNKIETVPVKRGRGRPKGSKNRRPPMTSIQSVGTNNGKKTRAAGRKSHGSIRALFSGFQPVYISQPNSFSTLPQNNVWRLSSTTSNTWDYLKTTTASQPTSTPPVVDFNMLPPSSEPPLSSLVEDTTSNNIVSNSEYNTIYSISQEQQQQQQQQMNQGSYIIPPSIMNYYNITPFERCVLCGHAGHDSSTASVCCRRACHRLFCLKCIASSRGIEGAVYNEIENQCIVCCYQSRKRSMSDPQTWHFEFRDDGGKKKIIQNKFLDTHFVRLLRDMLPMGSGLFLEVSKSRQPCWRRKLGSGSRKHFSFRFYGGIFESRLEALEITKSGHLQPKDSHFNCKIASIECSVGSPSTEETTPEVADGVVYHSEGPWLKSAYVQLGVDTDCTSNKFILEDRYIDFSGNKYGLEINQPDNTNREVVSDFLFEPNPNNVDISQNGFNNAYNVIESPLNGCSDVTGPMVQTNSQNVYWESEESTQETVRDNNPPFTAELTGEPLCHYSEGSSSMGMYYSTF